MRYSFQPRSQIFLKDYFFMSFNTNMCKNISKNINKNLAVNTARNFLIMQNNLQQMHLKQL